MTDPYVMVPRTVFAKLPLEILMCSRLPWSSTSAARSHKKMVKRSNRTVMVKSKIERIIDFIRISFMLGIDWSDLEEQNETHSE